MALCSITQSTLYDSHGLQFSDAKNFGEIPTGSFDVVRWATHIPKHTQNVDFWNFSSCMPQNSDSCRQYFVGLVTASTAIL